MGYRVTRTILQKTLFGTLFSKAGLSHEQSKMTEFTLNNKELQNTLNRL
jgi:hypothetical protein